MIAINLIPPDVLLAQTRRRHLRRWSAALILAFLLLAAAVGREWVQQAHADELAAEMVRVQADLTLARQNLKTVAAETDQVALHLQRAETLRAKRAWSRLIAFIGHALPHGCWLTSLATDPARPGAGRRDLRPPPPAAAPATGHKPLKTEFTIEAPRKLRLSGFAADPAEPHTFVTRLKEAAVFRQVVLERSQREPVLDGIYYRFEITCEW